MSRKFHLSIRQPRRPKIAPLPQKLPRQPQVWEEGGSLGKSDNVRPLNTKTETLMDRYVHFDDRLMRMRMHAN